LSKDIFVKSFSCSFKSSKRKAPGEMILSLNYLCYSSILFGDKAKDKIPLNAITSIEIKQKRRKYLVIEYNMKSSKDTITFKDFENIDEVYNILTSLKKRKKINESSEEEDQSDNEGTGESGIGDNEDDWRLILDNGTITAKYSKDEHVITEGDVTKRIYQISKGSCRIVKTREDDTTIEIAKIHSGESVDSIFGEISFIGGGNKAASASVIADEDTTIYIIEPYFLNILFQYNPSLCGRFYYFLSKVLCKRLSKRQAIELNLAQSTTDLKIKKKDKKRNTGERSKKKSMKRIGTEGSLSGRSSGDETLNDSSNT